MFPKQYHKNYFQDVDRTFLVILFLSFIVHFGVVGYFVMNPIPVRVNSNVVKSIQEQFASLVLDREDRAIKVANELMYGQQQARKRRQQKAAAQNSKKKSASVAKTQTNAATVGGQSSGPESGASRTATQGRAGGTEGQPELSSRQQRQQQIAHQVASQGILGVLTGSGRNTSQQAIQDVLGSGENASSDFAKVFNNVDKLTTRGGRLKGRGQVDGSGIRSSSMARGGRTTKGGTITTEVSKIGEVQGSSPTKTTSFAASGLTPLADNGEALGGSNAGARDANLVRAIVEAHSPAIEYCYNRELKRNPDLKGKIVVRFTINPAGRVIDTKIIQSTLNSESVERCILSRISRWDDFGSIEPNSGNATFRQVYTFGF